MVRDATPSQIVPLTPAADSPRSKALWLAPEFEREAAARLGKLAFALAVVFTAGTVIRFFAVKWGPIRDLPHPVEGSVVTLTWALISTALGFYASKSSRPGRVLKLGLAYEVVMCWDIAVLEQLTFDLLRPPPRPSFIVIVLFAFPLVVPAPARQRLLTTLLCLLALPFGTLMSSLLTGEPPPTPSAYFLYLPTVVAGLLALYLSKIVLRLNTEASKAQRLGSYELVERLGGGGMGEVWRATHRFLVRPAAIKLIRDDQLTQHRAQVLQRFEREAQATSLLTSPHTVELYDFGRTQDGALYYAMELLDGMDLETLVTRFGPMPPERVVWVLEQACDSLADAHAHGLIHRDIKPANLFLCRIGLEHDFVKVLDFGLVKPNAGDDSDAKLSRSNVATGTPAYMAPEVALGTEIDGRADLYGLGCVAFYLLTGTTVFEGRTAMEIVVQHVEGKPRSLSELSKRAVPRALEALIMACLAKKPEDRPRGAVELRRELLKLDLTEPWTQQRASEWWQACSLGSTA